MKAPNYDLISPIYDLLKQVVFGQTLYRASAHFCRSIPEGCRLLSVGGGTGRLESELAQQIDYRLVYVESSVKMTEKSRQRTGPEAAEFFVCREMDLPDLPAQDVLFTHFFLDNFSEKDIGPVARRCAARLKTGGLWFVSDFRIAYESRHRFWQKPFLRLMYFFFGLTSGLQSRQIPEIEATIGRLGFRLRARKTFWNGFIFTAVYRKITG